MHSIQRHNHWVFNNLAKFNRYFSCVSIHVHDLQSKYRFWIFRLIHPLNIYFIKIAFENVKRTKEAKRKEKRCRRKGEWVVHVGFKVYFYKLQSWETCPLYHPVILSLDFFGNCWSRCYISCSSISYHRKDIFPLVYREFSEPHQSSGIWHQSYCVKVIILVLYGETAAFHFCFSSYFTESPKWKDKFKSECPVKWLVRVKVLPLWYLPVSCDGNPAIVRAGYNKCWWFKTSWLKTFALTDIMYPIWPWPKAFVLALVPHCSVCS